MRHRILLFVFLPLLIALFRSSTATAQVYFLRDTFCANQILLVNNHLYGPDNPMGTETLPGAAANGADSIIEVRLVFYSPAVTDLDMTLCQGDTVWVNGVPYHAGFRIGQEIIEAGASNGCDSIIHVDLTFIASTYQELRDTLCPEDFRIVNGHRYDQLHPSGTEMLGTNALGCDSVINIQLVYRDLTLEAGNDLAVFAGDSICLSPVLNFTPVESGWTPALPCLGPDCATYCGPVFKSEVFEFYAIDATGCVLKDNLKVTVDKKSPWYAPTVFSPDADWPNNHFFLSVSAGYQEIRSLQIADRWGNLIFQRTGLQGNVPADGWDGSWNGKTASPGTYVFWAELLLWDQHTEIVSGAFTLIR